MSTPAIVQQGKPDRQMALALWHEYKATGDIRIRNHIVMGFMPLVRHIVFTKLGRMSARHDFDDFISCGLEALIGAIERYDPDKGATLEQFAWVRIRGALIDELRRQDWAPRNLRRWQREIAAKHDSFTAQHGRRPSTGELAGELGVTVRELHAKQRALATADVASLNSPVDTEDGLTERVDLIADDDSHADPETATAISLAKERFREAFGRLPRRQREVAVMLYVKNLTLREIGDVLGVSEGRVSQIHTQIRAKLKGLLAADAALFEVFV